MAGRKRNWNTGTPFRYRVKAYRVFYRDLPEDLAKAAAEAQTLDWALGSGVYKNLRSLIKGVLTMEKIPGSWRAPYYRLGQKLYKITLEKGQDAARSELDRLLSEEPQYDAAVAERIFNVVTSLATLEEAKQVAEKQ